MRKSGSIASAKHGAAKASAKGSAAQTSAKGSAAQTSANSSAAHDTRPAPGSQQPRVTTASTRIDIPAFSREHMVAEAAYFRAERRGFVPGGELQDWLDAVDEIEQLLNH